jgi:hypothetical protein
MTTVKCNVLGCTSNKDGICQKKEIELSAILWGTYDVVECEAFGIDEQNN